jgi:hypothetical protein
VQASTLVLVKASTLVLVSDARACSCASRRPGASEYFSTSKRRARVHLAAALAAAYRGGQMLTKPFSQHPASSMRLQLRIEEAG